MRAALAVLLLLTPVAAHAQDDAFAAVEDADPVELARLVDRLGDEAVLERLADDEASFVVKLAAVRAARYLVGPEHALAPLAELLAGRDPRLAPAAGMTLLAIGDRLSMPGLDRREVLPERLAPALERLDAVAADETARADLRAVAAHVAAQLRVAVPEEAAE